MSTHRFVRAAPVLVLFVLSMLSGCTCARPLTVQTSSGHGGAPVGGVQVQIDDGAWTTTGAEGFATLSAVTPPFILRVHQVATGTSSSGAYRSDDVWVLQSPEVAQEGNMDLVRVLVDGSALARSSSVVSGSVSGGSGGTVRVYANVSTYGPIPNTGLSGSSFTLPVTWEQWPQPRPYSVRIYAIETDGAVPPGSFSLGVSGHSIEDGQPLTGASVRLFPRDIGTVDGTVVLPPALSQAQASLTESFRPPGDGEILFLGQRDVGASFSAPLPLTDSLLGPGSFVPWLAVRAEGPGGVSWHEREVVVPSSGVAFDLPAPVDLVAPAAGAVIDASTVFRWTGGPSGGQTALLLSCDWTDSTGAARNVSYRTLEVTGLEATLPALPGLTIDPGATCQWKVAWYPAGQQPGATEEHRASLSESRSATFQ